MDPISAFSLACNIIQVVDFGFKLAAGCREIYASGSLESNDRIEHVATNLQCISEEIEKETAANTSGDRELKSLAIKSAETSRNLLSVLEGIKMKSQKGKRRALSKTFNTIWKKSAIDDLQKQLESYQKALETRLLKRMCDKFDLVSLQQKHVFASLDQSMQNMIQSLADGHTRLADLISREAENTRVHITKEIEDTRTYVVQEGRATRRNMADVAEANRLNIGNEFASLKITQADESHRKGVMDSLFFADIHSRQETIRDAHKNTFQWIFETSTQQTRPWSNFVEWLKCGQGIYWISGKAGSGKSTLMNYVFAEKRTREALQSWAGNRALLTPTFFFWNAGSTLQKSTGGLLRSLLYQILKQRPCLVSIAAQSPIATWTESRLLKALLTLISQEVYDDAICFFIDGLDEFQGDQQDLLDLINGIEQNSNVKICVSSRPLRAFQISFGSSPQLKLEDLTREDIAKLVNDKLGSTPAAELADTLTARADGVFLWVDLALKDLLRGVLNEDSFDELRHRLEILPQEIGDLYLHMLHRLDKSYHDSARFFLRLMAMKTRNTWTDGGMTILDFALATYYGIDAVITSSFQELDVGYLVSACRKLKTQILIRCAGLLELDAPPFEESGMPKHRSAAYTELLHFQESSKINFIHVSAYDFLSKDEKGVAFMNSSPSLDAHAATQLFKARLAEFRLLSHSSGVKEHGDRIWDLVWLGLEISNLGGPVEQLLDTMDRLFTEIQDSCNETTSRNAQDLQFWFTTEDLGNGLLVPNPIAYAKGPHGIQKPTFLGFAAWNGLFEYVCKKLDQLPQAEVTETASRMLILALASIHMFSLPRKRGAKQLFRCGADGGMVFEVPLPGTLHRTSDERKYSVTGWKLFLDSISFSIILFAGYEKNPWLNDYPTEYSSLADEFLSQPLDPGIVAEAILRVDLNIDRERMVFVTPGKSYWSCGSYKIGHEDPALVISMSPALLLDYLPGAPINKLPPEMRAIRTRRATQVGGGVPWRFYDLLETQAEYLTEAFELWITSRASSSAAKDLAGVTMRNRIVEVLAEFGLPVDEESARIQTSV